MIFCMYEGCDGETTVIRTSGSIRHRICLECNKKFITEEVLLNLGSNPRGGKREGAGRKPQCWHGFNVRQDFVAPSGATIAGKNK